jgi:hypothetical protein
VATRERFAEVVLTPVRAAAEDFTQPAVSVDDSIDQPVVSQPWTQVDTFWVSRNVRSAAGRPEVHETFSWRPQPAVAHAAPWEPPSDIRSIEYDTV